MDRSGKDTYNLFWVIFIALAGLALHLATFNTLGFHRDELLYLSLGNHLSTGYWSNPPMIGFIAFVSQLLPGDALFTTRLVPAIAGAVLIILTGLIARELGGSTYAQILSCISLSFSLLFLRAFSMLQPVPFDILCWTTVLYFLLKFINSGKPLWLIFIGIALGVGFLNKYMVIFLAAGIVIALLITPHRKILVYRNTWYAIILAFLISLPNLIWQINHGFPVFLHMKELKETQLVNVERINIILDQLLMFTLGSVIWVAGLIWLLVNRKSKNFRAFALIYSSVLCMFLVLKGKSYYMAGLYPFMFSAGGVAWEIIIKKAKWRFVFALILVLLMLPLFPGGIPIMSAPKLAAYYDEIPRETGIEALLRWEDGLTHSLPQDFADMLGWEELGDIVVSVCDTIQDKERIMIYAENYGQAAAVDHFGRPYNLPPVASFSDSYLMWLPDSIPAEFDMLVYINDEPGLDILPMFESMDSIGSITNPFARELGTTVYLYMSPKPEFRAFFRKKVKEIKGNRIR